MSLVDVLRAMDASSPPPAPGALEEDQVGLSDVELKAAWAWTADELFQDGGAL